LQLGKRSLQFAAAIAGLVEKLARVAQEFIDLAQASSQLIFLEL